MDTIMDLRVASTRSCWQDKVLREDKTPAPCPATHSFYTEQWRSRTAIRAATILRHIGALASYAESSLARMTRM